MKKTKIRGFHFSIEEGIAAQQRGELLTAGVETNYHCNLNCVYCAWESGKEQTKAIEFQDLKSFIKQVRAMGGQSVTVIGGGEPTLYRHFRELIVTIYDLGMVPVLITNGMAMTEEMADFLDQYHVSVFVKADSFKPEIQDDLGGLKDAFPKINSALQKLLARGFHKDDAEGKSRLAMSMVVTQKNIYDIPELWRFARKNNIYPNLEILNASEGRAKKNEAQLVPEKQELDAMLAQLEAMDEKEFQLVKVKSRHNPCQRHRYSAYLNVDGFIQPCSAVRSKDDNIKNKTLKEILERSDVQCIRNSEACCLSHDSQAIYDSQGN